MPDMLILGRGGSLNVERVIAIAPMGSAPIKRMLAATPEDRVLNMTYGYPRRSVLVLDNGAVVISSRSVGELTKAVSNGEGLTHDNVPWW
jgi:regulator of extracellular matrix RemA (YlzA/DUF370 family)